MSTSDWQAFGAAQSTASDSAECRLLQRLRDTSAIFEAIGACTPAEIRSQRALRDRFGDDDLVRAALTLQDARRKAVGKLPDADRLWLTQTGLEQSTAWQVARHKAQRFPREQPIADLCSGIGVDSVALAGRGPVFAFDADPAMSLRCEWNCKIWLAEHPVQARVLDVTQARWTEGLIHVDPDRRAGQSRPVKRLEQYLPDLEWMQKLTQSGASGAIKIGPASNFMQKFPNCEIELISLDGECREATVWFGELAGPLPFRATVLRSDDPFAVETISVDPLGVLSDTAMEPGEYLYDPDPAVVRSGMLDAVASQLGLLRLDTAEEYLTGSRPATSQFVTSFAVEAVLPNSMKDLRRHLKTSPSKYYEIKCRRIPIVAAEVQRVLPVGDAPPRTILFARVNGKARIVVARRVAGP